MDEELNKLKQDVSGLFINNGYKLLICVEGKYGIVYNIDGKYNDSSYGLYFSAGPHTDGFILSYYWEECNLTCKVLYIENNIVYMTIDKKSVFCVKQLEKVIGLSDEQIKITIDRISNNKEYDIYAKIIKIYPSYFNKNKFICVRDSKYPYLCSNDDIEILKKELEESYPNAIIEIYDKYIFDGVIINFGKYKGQILFNIFDNINYMKFILFEANHIERDIRKHIDNIYNKRY